MIIGIPLSRMNVRFMSVILSAEMRAKKERREYSKSTDIKTRSQPQSSQPVRLCEKAKTIPKPDQKTGAKHGSKQARNRLEKG